MGKVGSEPDPVGHATRGDGTTAGGTGIALAGTRRRTGALRVGPWR